LKTAGAPSAALSASPVSQAPVPSTPSGSVEAAVGRRSARHSAPVTGPRLPGVRSVLGTVAHGGIIANEHDAAARGSRSPAPPPRLPWPSPVGGAGAVGGAGGSGLLLYGLLAFAFLLAIPTAVRWLRAALALGLSPAYVALSDRPG
jgi:hypothetical protein